jgi:hypothetical protein
MDEEKKCEMKLCNCPCGQPHTKKQVKDSWVMKKGHPPSDLVSTYTSNFIYNYFRDTYTNNYTVSSDGNILAANGTSQYFVSSTSSTAASFITFRG